MRCLFILLLGVILAVPALGQQLATPVPTNLALHKFASQSSTYVCCNTDWGAYRGVDGEKAGSLLFHTDNEVDPWWQVDLGARSQLTEIRIYNRLDCCKNRSRTLQVLLSDEGHNWKVVYSHDGSIFGGADGKYLDIKLNNEIARFVRIQLREKNWFHLAEVEVYGYDWIGNGDALKSAGKFDEAIQSYDKAIELDPQNTQAWYDKGTALSALGRTTEASEAFTKAANVQGTVPSSGTYGTPGTVPSSGTYGTPGTVPSSGTYGTPSIVPSSTANGAQYCLLRKPYYPPQENCYEFYLADTTKTPEQGQMATVAGGSCEITPFAARQGWMIDPNFGGPYSDLASGDAAMGKASPYFEDYYGCHARVCPSGQTSCNGTCVDTNSDSQNCGSCGNACTQGESCVNGSCSPSGGTTPSTTQDRYAVFLLTNIAGGSIWVGSEQEIQTKPVCSFPGGGLCKNDGTDALVQFVKESQDFSSYDDAQAAYCAAPKSNVRSMALTGGTKANIYGGDYWIDTAPSCPSG